MTADIWFASRNTRIDADGVPVQFSAATRPGFLEQVNSDATHDMSPFLSYDWPAEGAKLYFIRGSIDLAIYEATWRRRAPPPQTFIRGECNDDGVVDVSDASCLLNWQFLGGPPPECVAAANTNGDRGIDIADAIYLLGSLFLGGPPPVQPFPACGPGALPLDAQLGCAAPSC